MALVDGKADIGIENDLLKQNEQAIEAKLTPATKRDYDRIVLAGMKVAINGGAKGVMRNLASQPDPVKACGIGAINLSFAMLKSQNTHPTDTVLVAATYAGYTLMLQALDVAAKMELVEITPEVIAKATEHATNQVFALMHATPQKMDLAARRVDEVMKDPAKMEKIELAIGSKRDPRAAQPVPEVEGADGPA